MLELQTAPAVGWNDHPSQHFVLPWGTTLHDPMLALDREHRFESHLLWEGNLGVGEQLYLLRVWNNFVYFTTAPQGPSTPVWTCLRPLSETAQDAQGWLNSPSELFRWWQREVLAGRFGHVDSTHCFRAEWGCVAVWGCRGVGQLRPWWDDRPGEHFRWPEGEWNEPEVLLTYQRPEGEEDIWYRRWRMLRSQAERRNGGEGLSEAEKIAWNGVPVVNAQVAEGFAEREVLPRHRVEHEPSWRRGNEGEAMALASAILHLDAASWEETGQLHGVCRTQSPLGSNAIAFDDPTETQQPRIFPQEGGRSELLLALLRKDFDPIGWQWVENEDEDMYSINDSGWGCQAYEWDWNISTPSYHEQMEALVMVNSWLNQLVAENVVSREDADLLLDWPEETLEAEVYKALVERLFPSMYDSRW